MSRQRSVESNEGGQMETTEYECRNSNSDMTGIYILIVYILANNLNWRLSEPIGLFLDFFHCITYINII